ncbi:MAG: glycosyltransferase family 4 protein [Phaeodactylibacter sp.]|nr:glycosyltransferase family 4 protein [Phaeodactylibacter sp.]
MKRKVLIHAPNLSTPGGKQTYYAAVKGHFQDEVSFFFYGAQGQRESKLSTLGRLMQDYRQFYRRLKEERFDVVLLNPSLNLKSFFRDSLFALICFWLKAEFVVFWHGWQWEFEKKVVSRIVPFFRATFGRAGGMIVLAREFQDKIREYGYHKPVFLETTVVDDFIFDYGEVLADTQEEEAVSVLLFLSRVEKVKGIYETIDSFHRLQGRHPNIVLNVAGTGSELETAKQYVAEKGIRNAHFLGWVTGEQKARLLYGSDIFLLASYHGEGMPCSLLEAMACGLSVVTTDAGGIKDFFQPRKMGLFVRPADTDDLERQLDELLSNPELLESTKAFNTWYAQERFRPELVAERLESIFEEVAAGRKIKAPVPARPRLAPALYGFLVWPPQRKQIAAAMAVTVLGLSMLVGIDKKVPANAPTGEGVVEEAIEEAIEEVSEELVQLIDRLDGESNKAF